MCTDLGCPDFDRAERNRKMIENRERIEGYLKVEYAVAHTPLNQRLPEWIPLGGIPSVADGEYHSYSGGRMEDTEEFNPHSYIVGEVIDNV